MKLTDLIPTNNGNKISKLLLIGALSSSALFAQAQQQRVQLSGSNLPLKEVFSQIEKQTNLSVDYKIQDIDDSLIIKNIPSQGTVRTVLSKILEGTNCTATFNEGHIIISKNTNNPSHSSTRVRTISGVVVDESRTPIIGANVMVKGTTNGTITDMDGKFSLNVPENAILEISYIGYLTQTIKIGTQNTVAISLKEDTQRLDEVVVIGYGTQAKKDITGAVSVVSKDAITEMPVVNFSEALQGKASGVYVNSTGAPGSSTTIRIRGIGSVNGSDPLIVVDGISNIDIDAVNPNDIESIQVLKDASATAIYGAQGANGVIIITTKQGKKDHVEVSYNGYVGWSKMANDGFDLLNGWEAMEFQEYGQRNLLGLRGQTVTHPQFGSIGADGSGHLTMPYSIKPAGLSKEQIIAQFGSIDAWEASYKDDGTNSWSRSAYYQMLEDGYSEEEARLGTNWYDQIVQTGLIQDHEISVLGGGEKGSYSLAAGYQRHEGTVKASYYERYSVRANSTFNLNKYFSIGQNTNLAIIEYAGDRGDQNDGNLFAKTYQMQPWVPVYNVGGNYAGSQASEGGLNISSVQMAANQAKDNSRIFKGQTALFAELNPFQDLKIRTQFSARLNGSWGVTMNEKTIASDKQGSANNSLFESSDYDFNWQWTNTATYSHVFNEIHNVKVVLGTEAMKFNVGRNMSAQRQDYVFEDDPNTWILNNGAATNQINNGYMHSTTTMFGLFGRADYSYKGKYLATVTVRRDASSKFGKNNRWGTFPSASIGWRISDEEFMQGTKSFLDDLKIRTGYGTTGNSNIGAYNYAFQYATGDSYLFAITGTDTEVSSGYCLSNLGDENAKWETIRMFNVGFDATLLNNRLTTTFDYYIKKTTDMLVSANWSALAGNAGKPNINIGDMENRGIDFSIGWQDQVSDFRYSINANLSHYRNEVVKLGSSDLYNYTNLSMVNRTTEGQPIGMFYGYKVIGIYQNADDVLNYKNNNGEAVLPYAIESQEGLNPNDWIGHYKIEDVNNDGKINADDRTFIGNPHPDVTGGVNISLEYKGFDLSTYLYFSVGNDIFRNYMYFTHFGGLQANYSKDRWENSWDPVTNPNGIYPLWATASGEGAEAANESNSTYIDDGSYLRMQTLTLGYSLPNSVLDKIKAKRVRIYGQISNLFTITGYDGLDPEIRSTGDFNKGIDYGSYGMPRQFILGLNVTF